MKQLEKWSGMKIGNIIFDSSVDNWNKNPSVFHHKIIIKRNLIYLIKDVDDNKFGGYIYGIIDNYGWIKDPKSFVFSLKSNGRLNGMLKFDITQSQSHGAFYLWDQSNDNLFQVGCGDICIRKEYNKNQSCCNQTSFNYNRIENAFCGKTHFTPKRTTVIQLI